MKRLIASILASALAAFLLWYAGVDFEKRGIDSAYCLFMALVSGAFVYWWPGWKDGL